MSEGYYFIKCWKTGEVIAALNYVDAKYYLVQIMLKETRATYID